MVNDIIRVFFTNLIKIFTTLITTFIIPRFLNINNYAMLKLYQMYVSYIGVFHLGFIDGVFLKYGGKKIDESNIRDINEEHTTLFVYQIAVSILFLFISFVKADLILFFFSLAFIPNTMIDYYRSIYQAVGNFEKYSKVVNYLSIFNLIINVILVFIFRQDNYINFLIGYTIVNYVVLAVSFVDFHFLVKQDKFHLFFSTNSFVHLIKLGFILMIGNFSYILFVGIDKWVIKWFLPLNDFAYYNFASSILSVINMFVTPISLTLYTYLCKNKSTRFQKQIKRYMVPFLEVLLVFSFVFYIVVIYFIKNYIPSISLIFILILAQAIISYNVVIYVNLFKVYKMQRIYLKNLVIMFVFSFGINLVAIRFFSTVESIAFATVITMCVWTILNMNQLNYLRFTINEVIQIALVALAYLSGIILNNFIIGFVSFLIVIVLSILIEYRNEFDFVIGYALKKIKNIDL